MKMEWIFCQINNPEGREREREKIMNNNNTNEDKDREKVRRRGRDSEGGNRKWRWGWKIKMIIDSHMDLFRYFHDDDYIIIWTCIIWMLFR